MFNIELINAAGSTVGTFQSDKYPTIEQIRQAAVLCNAVRCIIDCDL